MKKTSYTLYSTRLINHRKKCSVCKSEYREEIEERYHRGVSPYVLETDCQIPHQSIYRHIAALRLDFQRQPDFLPSVVRQLLANVDFDNFRPSDRLVIKALELGAKLSGEFYEGELKALRAAGIIGTSKGMDREAIKALRKVGISRQVIKLLRYGQKGSFRTNRFPS